MIEKIFPDANSIVENRTNHTHMQTTALTSGNCFINNPILFGLTLLALLGGVAQASYVPDGQYNPVWSGEEVEPSNGPDTNDYDGDGLPTWLEEYYHTDFLKWDSDGGGKSDGEELFPADGISSTDPSSPFDDYPQSDDSNNADEPEPLVGADVVLFLDVDLVDIFGFEISVGGVWDTDNFGESGVFGSGAVGVGINDGISIAGGYLPREIEGSGHNIDVNAGVLSPTVLIDSEGINGGAIGIGPGGGANVGTGYTDTFTLDDMGSLIEDATSAVGDFFNSLFE